MCGITGFLDIDLKRRAGYDALCSVITGMTDTLYHRGPDDGAVWVDPDPDAGLGLGFRRLAILDLSPLGRQPMHSADADQRYMMIFNGEIYNFLDLPTELQGLGHVSPSHHPFMRPM